MIDLHCHILPGLDDGAADLSVSIEMARMAAADGIRQIACTPHIVPGLYDNTASAIRQKTKRLQQEILARGIDLQLSVGADVHIAPNLLRRLENGEVPTLDESRYFLLEPPHHVVPPRIEAIAAGLLRKGYVPILTHPERLTWLEGHYSVFEGLCSLGVLVQLTAGSLIGQFGRNARYWSERLLDERRVDVVATDAHNLTSRPPLLARARDHVAARCGEEEADALVSHRPAAILLNRPLARREPVAAIRTDPLPRRGWKRTLEQIVRGRA